MSCNNVNRELEFYLDVATGNIAGVSNVSKFGYNPSVGTTTYESIWEGSNVYPWQTVADQLEVLSSSANDTSAGTGARTVELEGLDSSWNILTETVTMNGTTAVTTTGSFLRIFRARVVTAGSGLINAGDITIRDQDTSTTRALITNSAGKSMGQTLMAVYTVPAGKTAYLKNINFSSAKDLEQRYRLMARDNTVTDAAWNVKEFVTGRGGFGDLDKYAINKYIEKTDLDLQVLASATSSAAGGFELILIDN
ncbi:MAG: hypothetical protein ACPGRW_09445 [Flavobacteriaceae bacterium]